MFTCMLFVSVLLQAAVLAVSTSAVPAVSHPVERIAFGSCLRQTESQPVWNAILATRPDVFVFAGDNVYADTDDPTTMRNAYRLLANQPGYQRLRTTCPVHATWDDHDYGRNDAGAEYPMRAESERIFLDFFQIPDDAPERLRPGVYAAHSHGPAGTADADHCAGLAVVSRSAQARRADRELPQGPLRTKPGCSDDPARCSAMVLAGAAAPGAG